MKKIFLIAIIGVFSVSFQSLYAQQAYTTQRGQRGYTPPAKPLSDAYIELKDPYEETSLVLPKCVEAFKLDAFEKEILKGMLIKKYEGLNAILENKDNNREERKTKMQSLDKAFHLELSSILSPNEIESFKSMDFVETKEERKEKKKKKKNRKNKND